MPVNLSGLSIAGALLVAILSGGCTPGPKADPADAAASTGAATAAPGTGALPGAETRGGGDEIRPVYPVDAGPPDPQAERFCDAVLVMPERRKAECCSTSSAVAAVIGAQCVRTLTYALGQHAVSLAPADVDRCVEAMSRATAGCSWVTPLSAAIPPECDGVVKGALAEKAQCRSSLECPDGLRCVGLSTVDLGTCGPPKPDRSQCNIATDMLATFTRQEHLDRAHPECQGYCGHSACAPAVAPGGDCAAELACAPGSRCSAGKCTSAPLPAAGEACTDACVAGARCMKGKCVAPRTDGDACEADAECRGACVRADGGAAGTCAKVCPVLTLPVGSGAPAPIVAPRGRPGVMPKRR